MRITILTLLCFTTYCLSTVNGLSIREATEATIDETMTVLRAEDKNITNFQPEINNKTEDVNIPANGPVEVTNNQTEKEKAKVNIVESSSTITNTTSKPTDGPNIPTSTTTTTTTSPVLSTSSSPLNTSMAISPIISPLNETNPIIDLSAVNDTVANAIFTDLEELLSDLNDPNATSIDNVIDTAAGGVPGGSPDEFASSSEVYIRSIRTRSISESNYSTSYELPIEVVRNDSPVEMVTNLPREVTTETELKRVGGNSINHSDGDGDDDDDEKLEIFVDEPRTAESEKHWAKFGKVTGYKIIWLSDKNQNGRKAEAEAEAIGSVDDHSSDPKDTSILLHENDHCDHINETDYFSTEINSLDRLRSLMGHGYRRVVKTVQCGIMGLSKILELLDDEIEDWTDESILPLNEINRLERKIVELENFKCSCPVPLFGDILHSIYIDPFLHEKRTALYKNHEWSSIISDLRSSHVKVKHFYYALHRHHNGIENLFNMSIALSHKFYLWRAKQMDIVVANAQTVRHNPYYNHYNRGSRSLYFKPSLSVH